MAEYVFGGTTVGCKSPGRQPAHMVRQIGAGVVPDRLVISAPSAAAGAPSV
jgi:hypothetical protein